MLWLSNKLHRLPLRLLPRLVMVAFSSIIHLMDSMLSLITSNWRMSLTSVARRLIISCLRKCSLVSSLSRALQWLRRGETEVGEDEEEDDTEGGKLQLLLLPLQPPPPPPLPPQGSLSLSRGTGSSPRSERTRLSGTLRPSFSSMSLRSGSGPSSMTFQERG